MNKKLNIALKMIILFGGWLIPFLVALNSESPFIKEQVLCVIGGAFSYLHHILNIAFWKIILIESIIKSVVLIISLSIQGSGKSTFIFSWIIIIGYVIASAFFGTLAALIYWA